jgi:hypothetical protein
MIKDFLGKMGVECPEGQIPWAELKKMKEEMFKGGENPWKDMCKGG